MDTTLVTVALVFMLLYSNVDCSMKKGLGVSNKLYKCDDLAAFENLYWWYDWAANFDEIEHHSKCDLSPHIDTYVPMIWGYRPTWDERKREVDKTDIKHILGFNEPNHHAQSDLTPAEAAAVWHLVEKAANGGKIVSPAAAPCGSGCNGDTKEWLDQFFDIICENETTSPCRVDYIATHHYSCNPDDTMNFLKDLHKEYGLDIWLTEFACPYSTYAEEQLYDYMEPLLPMLEEADFIYRYAWYMARENSTNGFITKAVSLLDQSTSQLTDLGRHYNSFYRPYTTTTKKTQSTTTSTTASSTTSISSSTSSASTQSSSSASTTKTSPTTTKTSPTTIKTSPTTTKASSTSSTVITTVESGSWKIYSLYNSVLFNIVFILFYSVLM